MTLNCGPFEACRTLPRHQQSPTYGPAAGYLQCKLQKNRSVIPFKRNSLSKYSSQVLRLFAEKTSEIQTQWKC